MNCSKYNNKWVIILLLWFSEHDFIKDCKSLHHIVSNLTLIPTASKNLLFSTEEANLAGTRHNGHPLFLVLCMRLYMTLWLSVCWSVCWLHLFLIANFAVLRLAETHCCPCPMACNLDSRVYGLVFTETVPTDNSVVHGPRRLMEPLVVNFWVAVF